MTLALILDDSCKPTFTRWLALQVVAVKWRQGLWPIFHCPCNDLNTLWTWPTKRPWSLEGRWPWVSMNVPRLLSSADLCWKWWLLRGGRTSSLYATAHMMTLTADLDLLNNLDPQYDLDLHFQWLFQHYIWLTTCTQSGGCNLAAESAACMPMPIWWPYDPLTFIS